MDLLTKQPVIVMVEADSRLRKLPQVMAQRIAMRLKGQTPESDVTASLGPPANGGAANAAAATPAGGGPQGASGGASSSGAAPHRWRRRRFTTDASRLPTVTIADFQKGDAVILVSTEGGAAGVTAITMGGWCGTDSDSIAGEPRDGAVAVEFERRGRGDSQVSRVCF